MESSSTHVVFYNIWGHRLPDLLANYFREQVPEVDIFCLTEVTNMNVPYHPVPVVHTSKNSNEPPSMLNGLEQVSALLAADYNILHTAPRFEDWTCELTGSTYKDVGFGSALVYKKSLDVVKTGEIMITFMTIQKGQRPLQWMVFDKGGVRYLAAHLHGVWLRENTKGDDPIRDQQSAAVVFELSEIVELFSVDKVIFGGDLNLAIDTRALRALEYDPEGVPFLKNLIREHGIQNTRTARYRKFHIAHEPMHADYAFVSDNVDVKRFEVKNEVDASDHAPLHLIFS